MEYKFKLTKLHCAACAMALEDNLNRLDGVRAEINFVTKIMKLEILAEDPDKRLVEVLASIKKFDSMVEVSPFEDENDIIKKEKQEQYIKFTRFGVSIILSFIAIFLKSKLAEIILFGFAYLIASYDVLISAIKNAIRGRVFDEKFLMSIASIGAFAIGEFIEAVAVVVLFGIGEILEDLALRKSRRELKSVLDIKQPFANVVDGNNENQVSLEFVKVGDIIRIKPGEKVPLDCEILEGNSYLDLSALTGESKEQFVQPGEHICSGAINGSGIILAKVDKLENESTVSKIVSMIESASERKTKSERFITKFSKIYTPIVIVLAGLIAFIPPIFVGFNAFSAYLYRSLCFLVVSCPCALVISVPLAYFVGIGSLAKKGVVVKGSNFLEELSKTSCVIFDKTGTLTEGNFEVTEIVNDGEKTKEEILEFVAYAESFSNHKIAKSVVAEYNKTTGKKINTAWVNGYAEIAGKGIKTNVFMQDVLVGNGKLLKENGIDFEESKKIGTIIYVAVDGKYAGYIVINDKLKKDSALAVELIKTIGIDDICLSTGDSKLYANNIAEKVKIKNVFYDLLPEDKVLIITDKVQSGKVVAFVGDGINDGPSLANANVGISMGALGSDSAIEASDIVILTDEPSKVAETISASKRAHKIAKQNIVFALAVKIAVLLLSAIGIASMWLAIFADVGISLLAIMNSLRLLR